MVTKEHAIDVLKTYYDPEISINIMGWVVDLIGVFLIAHLGKKTV
ncbi:hypothetical protein ACT9XH_10390 [Methanococcoides methylutens]